MTNCPCGDEHPNLAKAVADMHPDPLVDVKTPEGTWRVPRLWIAAHGLAARDLPKLAEQNGFAHC